MIGRVVITVNLNNPRGKHYREQCLWIAYGKGGKGTTEILRDGGHAFGPIRVDKGVGEE